MSRGRVRINYGDRKDGHYIWYSGAEVFVEDPTAPDVGPVLYPARAKY